MPAWDKRNVNDPKKDYGIHCVGCFMALKGSKGAVSFVFYTGMWLKQNRSQITGTNYLYPMGVDVGYHSLTPMYEGHKPHGPCEFLNGKDCYCDGSSLTAERWMDILVEKGSEVIWEMLEENYVHEFGQLI